MAVDFNEICFASAKKIRELLGDSTIWGGSDDQIFESGRKYSDESLILKRNVNLVPGTLAPAACKIGIDMGKYVSQHISPEMMASLNEEYGARIALNEQLDAQLQDLVEKRAASEIVYRCLKAAKEYRDWTPPTFNREWKRINSADVIYKISNAVYEAEIYVHNETWRKKPYRVSYEVRLREVRPTMSCSGKLVVQGEQFYADGSEARLCVERRKKAFEKKFFTEDYPPIPKEYEYGFMWAGALLPGYRVEEG